MVKGAVGPWGAPREILSDNGRRFVAWRGETWFQKVLKRQGIGHFRSAPPASDDIWQDRAVLEEDLEGIIAASPFRLLCRCKPAAGLLEASV